MDHVIFTCKTLQNSTQENLREEKRENVFRLGCCGIFKFSYILGCCYYQTRAYMKFGQPKGFSPDYYIYKISDFDSAAKSLRVVKVNRY